MFIKRCWLVKQELDPKYPSNCPAAVAAPQAFPDNIHEIIRQHKNVGEHNRFGL